LFTKLSLAELSGLLQRRDTSAREVTQAFLDRIQHLDGKVGSYLTVDPEKSLAQADAAQALLDAGGSQPLTGVPIAIKDNISTDGMRTTCASKVLEDYVPPYDATVVSKLQQAGVVNLGKTNLDEFAMGTSCENSALGVTRNPWDLDRSPGGSSGGSAACVAGELAPASLGSDTGGSIRLPASFCGIVGFKPTYGRVSRYGLVAFGSSLDQIGPMTRTVEDAALLAEAISGHDPLDSTSLPEPPISAREVKSGTLKGLRLAVPREMLEGEVEPGVREVFEQVCQTARAEGATVEEVSIPAIKFGVTTYYIIAPAEASSNLGRYDGIRYGSRLDGNGHVGMVAKTRGELFGHEVKARIMIGTYALSAGYYDAYYLRAQKVRALMAQEFESKFAEYDLVLSPVSPVVAFRLGELNDPLALKLLDVCTIPANMGGFPAISLNGGFSSGLPVGVQLMGPVLSDERLLQAAYALEQALPAAAFRAPQFA